MTAHRRENLGQPIENICNTIIELTEEFKDIEIVYPVHYNPILRDIVFSILDGKERIHLINPLDTRKCII